MIVFGAIVQVIALSSCVPYRTIEGENRALPRKPDWTVTREHNAGLVPIEYDCVYVAEYSASMNDQKGVVWYRFWPGGQVAMRYLLFEGTPQASDFDSLRWCDVGYYRWNGTQVLMEFYSPHYNYGDADYYVYVKAEMVGNALIEKKVWRRKDVEPSDSGPGSWRMYRRVPVRLTHHPDW